MSQFPFIIGTAGHIDHGKTSLIKALTGMDTDRLKEEKERGISIDLGFAYLDLPDGAKAGIVDVPGHEKFIRNMLAGATGIDLVLFVVAADDGIMPQTREHLDIMRLLGIGNGIFVITKMDLADESRVSKVIANVKELIKDTCLKDSPIVPVSAATGFGIDNLKKLISEKAKDVLQRPEGGFFRLPIDRSFSIKGFGTVVTGTVASGTAQKNDEAVIISKDMDIPRKVKIRGIQSYFKAEDAIAAGQRAAINLSGISHTEIKRGNMLASADMDMIFDAAYASFEFLPAMKRPIKNYLPLKLHHMTDETLVKVVFDGAKEAAPGAKVFGQLRLKEPMAMMRGDRFILRDPSINATVGGGKILLPCIKERSRFERAQYQILDSQDLRKIVVLLLSDSETDSHAARLMLNLSENKFKELLDNNNKEIIALPLSPSMRGIKGEGKLMLMENLKKIEQRIIDLINKYHSDMPGDSGIDENQLRSEALFGALRIETSERAQLSFVKAGILPAILDNLISSGRIVKSGNVVYMPSHKPKAKGLEKEIEDEILSLFSGAGFNPIKKED
ncbi:MAG: selenocysteine-specific translation elongation factor, partial [Deltaproteobacteria bacterium]|nr:selenocysteine-specific translation elongation factor [Deltaproteobacteria bacterium]